jgi:transglutaminase-like putative cysteine protease
LLFEIRHHTCYHYSSAVRLGPQWLRFHPRDDATQQVLSHRIDTQPKPNGQNLHLDLEGNRVTQLWFNAPTERFEIEVRMQVRTLPRNAYAFILLPEATRLPIAHGQDNVLIRGYLQRTDIDEAVTRFAGELGQTVEQDTLRFLELLNRTLYTDFEREIRDTGDPQRSSHTLQSRRGACRDLSMLFVDCCRAQGIPARFASGYQKGNTRRNRRYLHAWPEVYLAGAGWRAYDPTRGEIITDTHVTIAAAAHPRDTMPVTGGYYGEQVKSRLDFDLQIQLSEV